MKHKTEDEHIWSIAEKGVNTGFFPPLIWILWACPCGAFMNTYNAQAEEGIDDRR